MSHNTLHFPVIVLNLFNCNYFCAICLPHQFFHVETGYSLKPAPLDLLSALLHPALCPGRLACPTSTLGSHTLSLPDGFNQR